MSFATRQVTFGRPAHSSQTQTQTQQFQPQSQSQPYAAQSQSQPTQTSLALPYSSNPYLPGPTGLALPGPSPAYSQPQPAKAQVAQPQQLQQSQSQTQSQSPTAANALAGPSSPPSTIPATPAPLTLEQQHITAVEGIVPTLQNIVATVNLDCRLDLKTIALHARNAEYNPKVGPLSF